MNDLYVIAVISNPCRYRSRYELYRKFARHVTDSGARLLTVEAAFGDRAFEVTESNRPDHVQLRTDHEVWHKENLINIGISRLPSDWKYVAWVDADVSFARPDWAEETVAQLQHHPIVQMFSVAHDLSASFEPFQVHRGFGYSYQNKLKGGNSYEFWHPGFAWAATREAINGLGQLMDWAVLGAADHHMALALIGEVHKSMPDGLAKSYWERARQWQERAEQCVKRNLGFVEGLLLHHWHGKKRDRRYVERWSILQRNGFDPELDLKRDWQGLFQLTDRNPRLRDELRHYFRARNEDSIDLE